MNYNVTPEIFERLQKLGYNETTSEPSFCHVIDYLDRAFKLKIELYISPVTGKYKYSIKYYNPSLKYPWESVFNPLSSFTTYERYVQSLQTALDILEDKFENKFIMKPTQQEYEAAKEVVAAFEKSKRHNLESIIPQITEEIRQYFDKQGIVKKFRVNINTDFNRYCLDIHPFVPQFDEDYHESDAEQLFFKQLGEKYGFDDCGVATEYFSK